jgi:hypothetical protein
MGDQKPLTRLERYFIFTGYWRLIWFAICIAIGGMFMLGMLLLALWFWLVDDFWPENHGYVIAAVILLAIIGLVRLIHYIVTRPPLLDPLPPQPKWPPHH